MGTLKAEGEANVGVQGLQREEVLPSKSLVVTLRVHSPGLRTPCAGYEQQKERSHRTNFESIRRSAEMLPDSGQSGVVPAIWCFPLEPCFEINPGILCSGIDNSFAVNSA